MSGLARGSTVTSRPGRSEASSPCDLSQKRKATSWVLPTWGEPSLLPFRSSGPLAERTTSEAPPEAAPAITLSFPCERT